MSYSGEQHWLSDWRIRIPKERKTGGGRIYYRLDALMLTLSRLPPCSLCQQRDEIVVKFVPEGVRWHCVRCDPSGARGGYVSR